MQSAIRNLHPKLLSCMPESAGAALCLGQSGHDLEFGLLDPEKDHLCDPVAAADRKLLVAEVEEDHPDLAAVIRIDRSRAVQHADAVLQGQPAAGADLALVSLGNGN